MREQFESWYIKNFIVEKDREEIAESLANLRNNEGGYDSEHLQGAWQTYQKLQPAVAVPDERNNTILAKLNLAKSLVSSEIKNSIIEECIEFMISITTKPSAEQISKIEKEKSKNWDYYQKLVKQNGFLGITDLLARYRRCIEQPNSEPKRITEQDAREICNSYWEFCAEHVVAKDAETRFNQWLENKNDTIGRTLLDKLNDRKEGK